MQRQEANMRSLRLLAVALYLATGSACNSLAADPTTDDRDAVAGLWSGSWGLYISPSGVVHQPVIAELVVKGDRVELDGFPDVGRLAGTIRFDTRARQIRIVPAVKPGSPAAMEIVYGYEVKGDKLTLTGKDKRSIDFSRCGVAQVGMANAAVQLLPAAGINGDGDLLVTEFVRVRAGQAGETLFEPSERKLKTATATILVVQEAGLKKINVDEARRLIRGATPVAVAYREPDRAFGNQQHKIWNQVGPVLPDSEAVARTFSRLLRPGTLVFVLAATENAPVP
jgi:hypothetical protein